jgi:uncharacterized protein (DUF1778 family)
MYGENPYTILMARNARKAAKERASARMELRVPPSAKAFIRRAMAISGRSAAELAYEGAKRVLEEHERMVLTGRDRDAFLAAVRRPPQPAKRLISAFRRHDNLRRR